MKKRFRLYYYVDVAVDDNEKLEDIVVDIEDDVKQQSPYTVVESLGFSIEEVPVS